jgi:GDP-D-mannose dehydratase
VIRFLGGGIRFFSAGSLECFGDKGQTRVTEGTPMRPGSPCEVANHRSTLGPKQFVTQKIAEGVKVIKRRISPATSD